MNNILVSGASGVVGYGILRSLRRSGNEFKLIGTSIYNDSVAQGFCDVFEQAPHTDDATYMKWLSTIIRKHKIDLVVPGIEIDMYKWVENVPEIKECGAVALLNNRDLILLCKDKWNFYKNLKNAGISSAIESAVSGEFDALKARFGLPFLLKPRQGYGSRDIKRINNEDDFSRFQKDLGSHFLAQQIVGSDDQEYTVSAFCDGQGGFYASMALRRTLSKDGYTEKAEVADTDAFDGLISQLCKRFRPLGPTNFQFRKCVSGIKLLEINPRISSSTSIRAAFGYNESAMAVEFYLEQKAPTQPEIKRGRAVRYIDEYIFYENSIHL